MWNFTFRFWMLIILAGFEYPWIFYTDNSLFSLIFLRCIVCHFEMWAVKQSSALQTIRRYSLGSLVAQLSLTLHRRGSQARNQPVKVGGSKPCLIIRMGVSVSLPLGWVCRYSWAVVNASFLSTSLASCPIHKKTWREKSNYAEVLIGTMGSHEKKEFKSFWSYNVINIIGLVIAEWSTWWWPYHIKLQMGGGVTWNTTSSIYNPC